MSARVPGGNFGVSAMAGLSALGLAACTPGNGSGPTTIIQTVVNGGGSSTTTSTTPSVTPISDPKKLCRVLSAKGQEVVTAIDGYWDLTVKGAWSWSDPEISKAADHAKEVVEKDYPALKGSVGENIPGNIADAWKNFAEAAKDFSQVIGDRGDNGELNPLNIKFRDATDAANHSCGY